MLSFLQVFLPIVIYFLLINISINVPTIHPIVINKLKKSFLNIKNIADTKYIKYINIFIYFNNLFFILKHPFILI